MGDTITRGHKIEWKWNLSSSEKMAKNVQCKISSSKNFFEEGMEFKISLG